MAEPRNVFGEKLEICCTAPMTGFYRTGICETGPLDAGTHVICAQVTEEFLAFTRSKGNDLVTPAPEHAAGDSDGNPRGRPQVRFLRRPEESRH
jgi:uncharacterized protein (DUF2237 family)